MKPITQMARNYSLLARLRLTVKTASCDVSRFTSAAALL
jgi:hypothetical protein